MKRLINRLTIFALPLLAASACSVAELSMEQVESAEPREVTVYFTTAANTDTTALQAPTKTAFGEYNETEGVYPTLWTASDSQIAMSLNMGSIVNTDVHKDQEVSPKATFAGTFQAGRAPYKFYALSPLSAALAVSPSREAWEVNIPAAQTPKADGLSCDESAMLIYAVSEQFQSIPQGDVELYFNHATAYLRLALGNIGAGLATYNASGAKVKGLELTFSTPVAGEWYLNLADGSIEEKAATRTIALDATITDLNAVSEFWVALAPCVLDGQSVKVSVLTDKGVLSRTYTYGTRTYAAGTVNRLGLDMSKDCKFAADLSGADVLNYEQYGIYLTSGKTLYSPTLNQLRREYSALIVNFAFILPAQFVSYEFLGIPVDAAKGDNFSLTVNKMEKGESSPIGTFDVYVVKEEGAKLWLATTDGNGFIIKR